MNIDFKYRDVLYGAANNPVLGNISQYLYYLTLRIWYIVIDIDWAEEVQAFSEEIEQTLEALSRKDPQEAGKVRREWLIRHLERIKKNFLGVPGKVTAM